MSEFIYGRHAVMSVLLAGKRRAHKLFLLHEKGNEILIELGRKTRVPVQVVVSSFLDKKLPQGAVHQGIMLEAASYPYVTVDELLASDVSSPATLLLLDEIQDPQNLGALIRSAYLLGVKGVVIAKGAGINEGCLKASSGATEYLPIAQISSLANALKGLKENGYWIYGTDPEAQQDLYDEEFPPRVALVIGGEGRGVRPLVKERCDILLRIPIQKPAGPGGVDSLNASAAGGIFLYEVVRQRAKKKSHSP